jgi:hypothetical protein
MTLARLVTKNYGILVKREGPRGTMYPKQVGANHLGVAAKAKWGLKSRTTAFVVAMNFRSFHKTAR